MMTKSNLIELIENLYELGRTTDRMTESLEIGQGMKQSYILPPHVFIYVKMIIRIALKHQEGVMQIKGRLVTNLRYADDAVLMAESIQELHN